MKATGIVRRMDDLGRIVIPREIRRTMRINNGDPLEIYTDNGEVIFKKYSPVADLGSFAVKCANSLSKTSGLPTLITDKDNVIAVSGVSKKELTDKKLSSELEDIIKSQKTYLNTDENKVTVTEGNETYSAAVACPIISSGDGIGSVVFLENEDKSKVGEVEEKLAQSAAGFLGEQLQDQY